MDSLIFAHWSSSPEKRGGGGDYGISPGLGEQVWMPFKLAGKSIVGLGRGRVSRIRTKRATASTSAKMYSETSSGIPKSFASSSNRTK